MDMKKILFVAALAFSSVCTGVSAATEKVPAKFLKNIILVDGLYEYNLPLSRLPEFFDAVPVSAPLSSEEKTCLLFEEESFVEEEASVKQEIQEYEWHLNSEKVQEFLLEHVVPHVNQQAESVRIYRDEEGGIVFDGVAQPARWLNLPQVVALVEKALQEDVMRIALPIVERAPEIIVDDEELREMGIRDLLSVGESDFSGSTWDRMTNIEVGSSTMNGVLIPKGEVMSFNKHLGPVTAREGYVPELVILGPKVDKEYGGGLCQVSSTAFRMALLAGLPIVERWQHSFAVHYYEPWGTDATIYPGHKDMKFENNTDGALLIQTVMKTEERKLYFHLYGTKDNRKANLFSSPISNRKSPLPPRNEASTALAPGQVKRYSGAVAGFDVSWSRLVTPDPEKMQSSAEEEVEKELPENQDFFSFFSRYQPRGSWVVRGVSPEEKQEGEGDVLQVEGSSI